MAVWRDSFASFTDLLSHQRKTQERGFTLVEVLLVVVIALMVASVAVPSLLRARDAADSAVAVRQIRSMHTNQAMFRMARSRYGRLAELNTFANNSLGRTVGTTIRHRDFIFLMFPNPTDKSLKSGYGIIAYRIRGGRVISQYNMSENGSIVTVLP